MAITTPQTSNYFARHRKRVFLRRGGLAALVLALGYLLWTGDEAQTPTAKLTSIPKTPTIAVRIGGESPLVAVSGAWTAYLLDGPRAERGAELATGQMLEATRPVVDGGMLHLGPIEVDATRWLELVPSSDGAALVEGPKQRYRGALRIGVRRSRIYVVNVLTLEKYLQGVVGSEMPLGWSTPALEAQAIAARTYALYERNHASSGSAWDVRDTVASQVYGGVAAEKARALEVVRATRGAVLTWRGEPIKAFFHSTCGGHTADADSVFGKDHAIGPLTGRPCGHCRHSPVYSWKRKFGRKDIERRLGLRTGRVSKIQVHTVRGRARKVRVVGSKRSVVLPGTRLRSLMGVGRNGLRSTAFRVQRDSSGAFVFQGGGWGHGVGMCQYGAGGMAKAGAPARDILAHYYPGATLARLWE